MRFLLHLRCALGRRRSDVMRARNSHLDAEPYRSIVSRAFTDPTSSYAFDPASLEERNGSYQIVGRRNVRSLWENIFRKAGREEQQLHDLLARIPLFERLNRRELQAVARILYRRRYDTGEFVFRQGDNGIGMYIIERGSIAIINESAGQLLTELRGGDFFGEVALLNETRRSASARAQADTTLLCMLEPDLEDLGKRNPRIGFKVLLALARTAGRRLIAISDEYEELRRSLERHGEPASDTPNAAGERVIHEVRAGDGAGQTEPFDGGATAKSLD